MQFHTVLIFVFLCLLFDNILATRKFSNTSFPPLNLFIGTGGVGYGYASIPPSAQVPYGAIRASPDTSNGLNVFLSFEHFSGYNYADSHINMFSHTHMDGAGVVDLGHIGLMPIRLDAKNWKQELTNKISSKNGFRSRYEKTKESWTPALYQVELEDYKIQVDLTATQHAVLHRYQYSPSSTPFKQVVIFQSSYSIDPKHNADAFSQVNISACEITGWGLNKGDLSSRFGGVKVFFVAKWDCSLQIDEYGTWQNKKVNFSSSIASGVHSGAFISFNTNTSPIVLHVGISFISVAQARVNLQTETQMQAFEQVLTNSELQWQQELSRFKVNTQDKDEEIKYYSNLYHSMTSPTIWDEANGLYLGFDGQIRTKPQYMDHIYTDLSIWDVHRTEFPFILFHDAKRMNDVAQSIMLIYKEGGDLPKWQLANGYTGCMVGSHADVVLADVITKQEYDTANFDLQLVMKACRQVANTQQKHDSRWNPPQYVNNFHYVPYENDTKGAVLTLSLAYDDWAIGNIAKEIGLAAEAQQYYERSQWYRNVFDDKTKFFCPKSIDGKTFHCPSNALEFLNPFDNRYVEGDAWHYRFFVPHDTQGLIQLFGSKELFVQKLEEFFSRSEYWKINALPDPYYWAGNEHDLFSVWQFAYANRSDLTQYYTRHILDKAYLNAPNGIPGNNDYGTMSAWYLFASMGLYPLSGSATYVLGSPQFDSIAISRKAIQGGTCQFIMKTYGNSKDKWQVRRITLNGKDIVMTNLFLNHVQHLPCKNGSISLLEFYF